MSAPRTARVRREERRAAVSVSLARALDAEGLSLRETATILGCDESLVRRYADAHEATALSVADLAALPLGVRRALVAEHVAPEHDLVERGAAAPDLGCDLAHVRALMRDSAHAADVGLAAVADGHITADEGAQLVAAADAVSAAAARLRALGRDAMRERVIGVRRPLRAVAR